MACVWVHEPAVPAASSIAKSPQAFRAKESRPPKASYPLLMTWWWCGHATYVRVFWIAWAAPPPPRAADVKAQAPFGGPLTLIDREGLHATRFR
jgi:hypothetical protein